MRRVLLRLGFVALGLGLGAGALEVGLRASGSGLRGQVGVFVDLGGARVGLRPCATDRVRGPDARVTAVATDEAGHRAGAACVAEGDDVLVLGDSQVFGLGVEYAETFVAQLGAIDAGVPDYGVPDSLAAGTDTLAARGSAVRTVVVVVNQANDWEDGTRLAGDRNAVRRGYLLRRDRLGLPGAWVWSTPLGDSALVYRLWTRVSPVPRDPPPAWLTEPAAQAPLSAAFGAAIREFAEGHPGVRVVPAWLPADVATGEARAAESVLPRGADLAPLRPWADTTLRDQLAAALAPLPLVDLTDALRDPAAFLPHDFHLSVAGHAAVAEALRPATVQP